MRSNLGNVYRKKQDAKRWARGRPIRKVPGGWKIMAKRRRKKGRRKTFKKKSTAKRAARGRPVYKVIGGWRIGKKRARSRRRR